MKAVTGHGMAVSVERGPRNQLHSCRCRRHSRHKNLSIIRTGNGSCSPNVISKLHLLFIIAIDPLLRWLYSGKRQHALGATQGALKVPVAAYADELVADPLSQRPCSIIPENPAVL